MIKLLLLALLVIPVSYAHGHGQGLDTISDVRIDGKKLTITVEMPYSFEEGGGQITVTATDDATDRPVSNVTYLIGLFHDGEMLFRNYFFAQDGSLELAVEPGPGEIEIHGMQDDLLEAWSDGGKPVRITGPILDSGGLYSFEVELRTIDDPANIIERSETYVADVSVADTHFFTVQDSEGADEELAVRSYFDRAENLVYDHEEGRVAFGMPFDWGEGKIAHIPVVHVEVWFPKSAEFATPGYEGYVNGAKLFKSSVSIDDYTLEDHRIVHFVLLTDHLRQIKGQMEGGPPDTMDFELRTTQVLEFPLSAYTRGEDYEVNLSWEPREVAPGVETDFVFTIRDGETGEPVRNSDYDFDILLDGQVIYGASGTAQIGGHFERYTFAPDQTGPVIVRISDIRGTGLETEFGLVVLPQGSVPHEPVQEQGGGCLIATAAYGTELAPQVQKLRELRDNTVMNTGSGSAFMSWFNGVYYSFSPYVADLEREHPAFREAVRVSITPMIHSLSLLDLAGIDSEAEMVGYGAAIISLNAAMYAGVPALAIAVFRRR